MEIISGYKLPNTYHVLVQDSNGQYKYLFKGNEKKGKIDECQCYCCFFLKYLLNILQIKRCLIKILKIILQQ